MRRAILDGRIRLRSQLIQHVLMMDRKRFRGMWLMRPEIEVEISDTQGYLRVGQADIERLVRLVLAEEGHLVGSLSIAFVDNATIHTLNRAHLGHDWPTDVITFPLPTDDEAGLAGELVISTEMACATARELSGDANDELALYVVHGLLHLCGFDDEDDGDRRRMRRRENELLLLAGIKGGWEDRPWKA